MVRQRLNLRIFSISGMEGGRGRGWAGFGLGLLED
jgi:hypothetical protein